MIIRPLFDKQQKLDNTIKKNHNLKGDGLDWKPLALQVELGECANEWQGFKVWKQNPKPKDGLLEEFADCLHFILSVGNARGFAFNKVVMPKQWKLQDTDGFTTTALFTDLIGNASKLDKMSKDEYKLYVHMFVTVLGDRLGFTWEDIKKAYTDKNKINYERQASGY